MGLRDVPSQDRPRRKSRFLRSRRFAPESRSGARPPPKHFLSDRISNLDPALQLRIQGLSP